MIWGRLRGDRTPATPTTATSEPDPAAAATAAAAAALRWEAPTFPLEPRDEPHLHVVPGATLSSYDFGLLASSDVKPMRWVRGAVYDGEGRLVRASQRRGGAGGDRAYAADPRTLPPAPVVPGSSTDQDGDQHALPGTWLYVGHWMNHFGHFLVETLPSLWPLHVHERSPLPAGAEAGAAAPQDAEDTEGAAAPESSGGTSGSADVAAVAAVQGLLAHPFTFGHEVLAWQRDLLELAGAPADVRVMTGAQLEVENLLVPDRPYVPAAYAFPEARAVWQHMAARARERHGATPHERVFLSRSALSESSTGTTRTKGLRQMTNAAQVDALFASYGFEVVHPQELPVAEQVALAAGARVLAGASGSALHLSAFAAPGTRVVEVGDVRTRGAGVRVQRIIDRVSGHESVYVPHRSSDREYDLELLRAGLERLLA